MSICVVHLCTKYRIEYFFPRYLLTYTEWTSGCETLMDEWSAVRAEPSIKWTRERSAHRAAAPPFAGCYTPTDRPRAELADTLQYELPLTGHTPHAHSRSQVVSQLSTWEFLSGRGRNGQSRFSILLLRRK